MHDIKYILNNPDDFDNAMKFRNAEGIGNWSEDIIHLDKCRKLSQEGYDQAVQIRKEFEKNRDYDSAKWFSELAIELKQSLDSYTTSLKNYLDVLPNIAAIDVPKGMYGKNYYL